MNKLASYMLAKHAQLGKVLDGTLDPEQTRVLGIVTSMVNDIKSVETANLYQKVEDFKKWYVGFGNRLTQISNMIQNKTVPKGSEDHMAKGMAMITEDFINKCNSICKDYYKIDYALIKFISGNLAAIIKNNQPKNS